MTQAYDAKRGLAGKFLVYISYHASLGVCLRFPHELGCLIQWRYRVLVKIRTLRDPPKADASKDSQAKKPAPLDFADLSLSRSRAVHAALIDAQETLIDQRLFSLFRECVSRELMLDATPRWHVQCMSPSEVAFILSSGTTLQPVKVTVSYSPLQPSAKEGGDVWDWLSKWAEVHLRELFLKAPAPLPKQKRRSQAEKADADAAASAAMPNLFANFVSWAEPQCEAVARYMEASRSGDAKQE